MAQLAIIGHETRGNEVIELLEMLGGKLEELYLGNVRRAGYYINSNGHIDCMYYKHFDDTIIYTLESFLEKFPYKVGDKVKFNEYTDIYTISKMMWDTNLNDMIFQFTESSDNWWHKDGLQLCKKVEPMKRKIESIEIIESHCADEVKIEFDPSKYEMVERKEGYYVVKKQPQYPKTYEECCKILGISPSYGLLHDDNRVILAYGIRGLAYLQELLVCRDAYWKIAGEQMGLGKPWEPDFDNLSTSLEYIKIVKGCFTYSSRVFVFPTKEMCDAFYDNFEELIKECKSLL